jgi:hypothetical protein
VTSDAGPGVVIAADADGRRSTSTLGRTVLSRALAEVDPVGALAAEQETNWRSGYLDHFHRATVAGLDDADAWRTIAAAGLAAVDDTLRWADRDGDERPLRDAGDVPAARQLTTVEVAGDATPSGFALPYRGDLLRGDDIRRQVARWVEDGIVEPSVAPAVDDVIANPDWLRLEGQTVAVLGAGSEMGPAGPLLRWGATVAAVDLPDPRLWSSLVERARRQAGRLLVPVGGATVGDTDRRPERHAGVDLVADVPEVADWLVGLPGRLTVGSYVYADGATHVRLSAAIDLLTRRVARQREDLALAFLATPTDVFVVPRDAVEHATRAYEQRSRVGKLLGRPLRTVSRGRLLQRAYRPDADPGVADALVPQQGPNYALAKRIQRWRATTARAAGATVSFHVAPSTRTRSVTKNRALAAAFAGAHRFGVEVFEPATSNTLMAALLVRDLHVDPPTFEHPWQEEAHEAVHGGLWRAPYAPRSALGLAALLGYASPR